MANTQDKYDKERWLSLMFLVAGLMATGLAWQLGSKLVRQEQSAHLDARAREAEHSLVRQVNEYTEVLRGFQAQFAVNPGLPRAAFQRFAESLDLEQRLPGIQAVGFSPRVTPAQRLAFSSTLQRDYAGVPGADLPAVQASPGASDALMVRYIEPLAKNLSGIGFDHTADARRRVAIERARDSGQLAVSARVRLFIAPGNIEGIVFFLPLYEGGRIPATLEQRRQRFSGVVFLAIRVDDMLRSVFGPELLDDLALQLRHRPAAEAGQGPDSGGHNLIFDSRRYRPDPATGASASAPDPALQRRLALPVAGTAWQMEVSAQPEFSRQSQTWLPPVAAFAGALLSLLAFVFMRTLRYSRQAAEARARQAERSLHSRDEQLAQILQSIDEVLWTAEFPGGAISYVSPAVERVYGWPASAFYQNPRLWLECIHPQDRERVLAFGAGISQSGRNNQSAIHYRVVRPDGAVRWLRYAVHFVAGDTPGSDRVNSVGSDVTDEYLLQESLRRSNRALRAIHECDAKIAAAEDEEALLQAICEVVVKAGYRMAWTGLLNADGGIALTNIAGESQDFIDSIRRPLAENPHRLRTIDAALKSGRPQVANDFRQEANLPWRDEALRHGFNAKVALPLVQDEQVIGVFNVYAAEAEAFNGEELALLEGLAHSVLVALQALRHRAGRVTAEAALHLRQRAIEASANAIVITSASLSGFPVEYVNPAFERMTGYSAAEMVGRSLGILHRGDGDQPGIGEIRAILAEQREGDATLRNYRKDGTLFWTRVYIAPVRDDGGSVTHFVAAKYDITETRRYQEQLEFQANHDALTGLPNRNLLRDRLSQAIVQAARLQHSFWVAFLDLDHFKFINDTLGHGAGDTLLQEISRRLQDALRASDTVARQGGDEFVLILPDCDDQVANIAVVQRIMSTIAAPLEIDNHRFYPTCSIGIALYPDDGSDAETLIRHADVAMYHAKQNGRNNFQFFTAAMNERALDRLRLEADLRQALERDELLLHYQPQVCLRSGRMLGMEALIRWNHPQLGMIAPNRFIALAEETGLIVPIGEWVLRTACRQTQAWQQAGLGALRIAVNLSARQFAEPGLAPSIIGILAETGLAAQHLEIELTESMVMKDVEHSIGILRELKAAGMHLSIDDFGTGYSSLSYLQRFPLDVLKIDQSFVRDITHHSDGAAIVSSIISLAHSLRLQVIAEGVETMEQLAYLRQNDCDQIQGYYFSKPLAAAAFEELLRQGKTLELG
ncbi:MAG TPA: EAL domain-containing protein [Burkholderiaceae bacterium]|nr:EAL domain-containing protein [Burkholderiaceae bacterium]